MIPLIAALGALGAGGLLSRRSDMTGKEPGMIGGVLQDLYRSSGFATAGNYRRAQQFQDEQAMAAQARAQFDAQRQREQAAMQSEVANTGGLMGLSPQQQAPIIEQYERMSEATKQLGLQKPMTEYQQQTLANQDRRMGLEEQRIELAKQNLQIREMMANRPPDAILKDMVAGQGKIEQVRRINTGFQDSYAGKGLDVLGRAEQRVASKKGTPEDVAYVQWWQDYQAYANQVRNELFGAALTETEAAEFEKAMITPGMDPAQVKANLERQQRIAESGYRRMIDAYGTYYKGISNMPGPDTGQVINFEDL